MHHNASLDGDEIIERAAELEDMLEVQANAFASEFLIPRWLLAIHGNAQGWNRESLKTLRWCTNYRCASGRATRRRVLH